MQQDQKTDFEHTRISSEASDFEDSPPLCPHGFSDDDGICPECHRQRCLEQEAAMEAAWQHNVIGPMFGWEDEEEESVDPPEEEKKRKGDVRRGAGKVT